jgi:prefoldin subunit 5
MASQVMKARTRIVGRAPEDYAQELQEKLDELMAAVQSLRREMTELTARVEVLEP